MLPAFISTSTLQGSAAGAVLHSKTKPVVDWPYQTLAPAHCRPAVLQVPATMRGPMPLCAAKVFFGASYLLVTVSTFLAVGGTGASQALCKNDSMAEYQTPAYIGFLTTGLKKFTCTWFLIGSWWAIAVQLGFWLCVAATYAQGFMERHMAGNFAGGAVASTMSIMASLNLMNEGNYYTGAAFDRGTIAFWGFFLSSLFNGALGLAYMELVHSQKMAAAPAVPTLRRPGSDNGSDQTGGSLATDTKRRLTDESFV
ncbi:hypothetical protein ABPG77_008720 [Micractinium sp. CCAP 211/92]